MGQRDLKCRGKESTRTLPLMTFQDSVGIQAISRSVHGTLIH